MSTIWKSKKQNSLGKTISKIVAKQRRVLSNRMEEMHEKMDQMREKVLHKFERAMKPRLEQEVIVLSDESQDEVVVEPRQESKVTYYENEDEMEALLCPISNEIMTDPVMSPYGHCYQRMHIEI